MSPLVDCHSARTVLALYLDGELDAGESAALERHLDDCAACRQALAAERALRSAIRALPHPAMPPALADRVRASLPRAETPPRRWRRWAPAVAAGLALFLAGGVVGRLALPGDGGRISSMNLAIRDVTSAHIRALLSERVSDVASSDRHTVKPWFNGRVELAPPVEDFAAEGFPLVGGRLDFVDGRRAATIVYRRRQHIISLYVWPGATPAAAQASLQGYNLILWPANGMTFAAISDLNRAELESFAALLRARGKASTGN